jgi:hypothetical protein
MLRASHLSLCCVVLCCVVLCCVVLCCVVLCCVVLCCVVSAHAADKAVKRYIRLMTVRIDWNATAARPSAPKHTESTADGEGDEDEEEEQIERPNNTCDLVWTGVTSKRTFSGFKFSECLTAATSRKLMHTHGLAHFWDMVYQSKPAGTDLGSAVGEALAVAGIEDLLAGKPDTGSMAEE